MRARRGGRFRRLWRAARRFLGRADPPPAQPPPDEELDPVPVGPPRRPRPSTAAVLEPPHEPDALEYPTETDAFGRLFEDDDDEGARAAAH